MLSKCLSASCPYELKEDVNELGVKAYRKYKNLENKYIAPLLQECYDAITGRVSYSILLKDTYEECLKIYDNIRKCIDYRINVKEKYVHPECRDVGHEKCINLLQRFKDSYENHMSSFIIKEPIVIIERKEEEEVKENTLEIKKTLVEACTALKKHIEEPDYILEARKINHNKFLIYSIY